MKKLIIFLLLPFFFYGCAKNDTSRARPVQEDVTKPLRVLVDIKRSYASCRLEDGEFFGTEIDLVKRLAARMKRELVFEAMAFEDIIPTIKAGKADVGIARIIATPARLQEVDFSNSYAESGNSFLYYKGEPRPRISHTMGDKIGTLSGTTGDFFLSGQKCVSFKYDTLRDAFEAFEKKEIASLFFNCDELEAFVKNKTNASDFLITPREMREEYCIALAKNRTRLLQALNAALEQEGRDE